MPGLSLGELLDRAFSEDEAGQRHVRASFDLRENPDLPEMYEALVDVFSGWRGGRFSLRLFVNHGPEVGRSDAVGGHLRNDRPGAKGAAGVPLLDLIIEQRYTPLDYAVRRGFLAREATASGLAARQHPALLPGQARA